MLTLFLLVVLANCPFFSERNLYFLLKSFSILVIHLITDVIESIINGDPDFTIWSCSGQTQTCENPKKQSIALNGIAANVTRFFIDDGYLQAAHDGSDVGLAKYQQANYYNVGGASSKASTIARHDVDAAYSYIREISPVLAYSAAYRYISDLLTAAATGARLMEENDKSASVYYKDIINMINDARVNLYRSYAAAMTRYGGQGKIQEAYQYYMQSLPLTTYENDRAVDGSL